METLANKYLTFNLLPKYGPVVDTGQGHEGPHSHHDDKSESTLQRA